jgi:hypothetical protein
MFALSPALVGGNAFIDYSTSEGQKLYSKATARLSEDTLYDCEPDTLEVMLKEVSTRAEEMGWNDILDIPKDIMDFPNGEEINLIKQHGMLSLEQVQAHARAYVANESRAAQESIQLYHCLMNSLSQTGKSKIILREVDYQVTINNQKYSSGTCLLKVIITESYIDTNATALHLRTELSNLDKYMSKVGNDVQKFNQHVKLTIDKLGTRGQTSEDLLANLFKGYMACPDNEFKDFVKAEKRKYQQETSSTLDKMTSRKLMDLAQIEYLNSIRAGTWNAPSPEQEEIIALRATVQDLQKKAAKAQKARSNKSNQSGQSNKNSSENKRSNRKKPSWMAKPPKPNEPKVKEVDGKTYHWCSKHKAWGKHTPEECQGKGIKKDGSTNEKDLKMVQALQSVMEDDN